MKKLLLIAVLLFPLSAYATSGACSGHGGVNCSAGSGANGQVICNDGWDGSSVSYASMEECQTPQPTPPTDTNSAFAMKQQCASYTSAIQDEISNSYVYEKTHKKPGSCDITDMLDEVFYSPVANSCLYTETSLVTNCPDITIGGKVMPSINGFTYFIRDRLNNDSILYQVTMNTPNESKATHDSKITDYYNELAYYKGDTSSQDISSQTPAPTGSGEPYQGMNAAPTPSPAPVVSPHGSAPKPKTSAIATLIAEAQSTSIASTTASASTTVVTNTAPSPQPQDAGLLSRLFHFLTSFFKLF